MIMVRRGTYHEYDPHVWRRVGGPFNGGASEIALTSLS